MSLQVRRARDQRELSAALALRRRVFCEEQGVPLADELDGHDQGSLHLVALTGDTVVGTCRLVPVAETVQLSRLAVERAARRRGVASALLDAAESESLTSGGRRIVLHAQTYALALYRNHGYETRGRRFVEAGIEHVAMEKRLA